MFEVLCKRTENMFVKSAQRIVWETGFRNRPSEEIIVRSFMVVWDNDNRELPENKGLEEMLLGAFYWFHEHPELAYEEVETTRKIRELLIGAGIEILPYELETGLVAAIRGEKQGSVQALRCDIDALPVTEETSLPYCSKEPGKMHACGHDMHTTAGLGCAMMLQRNKDRLTGTVKIIFQPAEESALGALKILETDVMQDVERIWGFHADPTNASGVIGIREGYVAAAVDRFVIHIHGIGCHGAHPEDGIDPILTASAVVQSLQSIVSRNIDPFHPALLSVTNFHAGTTWNVIPPEAVLEGTVRTMDREDRMLYEKRLKEVVKNTAEAYGASADIEWISGSPAVYNDSGMADICERVAKRMGFQVVEEKSSMGGDDFAFYEEQKKKIPGCYVKIGTGVGHPIHHPGFAVKPEVIYPAAKYLAALMLEESLQQ